MATPENSFITSVHRHLPPESELHKEGMHNEYRGGTADMWYSGKVRDLWVEYKFIKVPVRDKTVIDLTSGKDPIISTLQQDWISERTTEGRNVWVIVGSTDGGVIFRTPVAWGEPFTAKDYRVWTEDRKSIAAQIARFTLTPHP